LVSDALAANKDLAQAAGNLQASRAAARLTGFDAYPTVTAGGVYQRTRESFHQIPGATRDQRTIDTYDVGFDATWELDFFGRVRREKEASRAEAGAAEATLRDAIVSVSAEVARNYCVLRGLQDQLAVAEIRRVGARDGHRGRVHPPQALPVFDVVDLRTQIDRQFVVERRGN